VKDISKYILENNIYEGIKLSSNSKVNYEYSDEELMKDYSKITNAYLKKDKEQIADKYNVSSIKIRDIQIAILDKLRENRKKKDSFDRNDIVYFIKYDIPENKYNNYLQEESDEFVEYLLQHYEKRARLINRRYSLSAADKFILKRIDKIKKYLGR
jgi:hypothetical protein